MEDYNSNLNKDYKYLYFKYKKKYLELKNIQSQLGGGKRYLKQQIDRDPLILTPSGIPNHKLNKFLLKPQINFLIKECSKDKKFSKLCTDKNISSIVTIIFTYEQNNQNLLKDLPSISKNLKLSEQFIRLVIENHQLWKKKNFILK